MALGSRFRSVTVHETREVGRRRHRGPHSPLGGAALKSRRSDAGKGADRLAAFSDALFAFAMTLLAIEVRVPSGAAISTDADLAGALGLLVPSLMAWGLCFFCVGLFWIAHHRMFRFIERADGRLVAFNLVLLFLVSVTPFGSSLVISYASLSLAWAIFAALMLAIGLAMAGLWAHACGKAGLVSDEVDDKVARYIAARTWVGVAVFGVSIAVAAVSTGAAELLPFTIFPAQLALRMMPGAAAVRSLG